MNPNWSEEMAAAYTRGLEDARAGRDSRESNEVFVGCYLQGFAHGQTERAISGEWTD